MTAQRYAAIVRAAARPIELAPTDYDGLLDRIGDARFVLIGDATHGTHELYRERAKITKRLLVERGFAAVAVEADWPDAYRVTEYVRGESDDRDAEEALCGFARFPTWMWRNADVLDFIGWLREHNEARAPNERVGFYGLDLYSMFASMRAVVDYLDHVDSAAARRARERYACFDHFVHDADSYGYAAGLGLTPACEKQATEQLLELDARVRALAGSRASREAEALFVARENARLVHSAEEYYRTMYGGTISSWNLRDAHMVETLDALAAHLDARFGRAKIVVWAHNSHVGDARATSMAEGREHSVGQLVRERWGADAFLVGTTTYAGSVVAAYDWDGPAVRRRLHRAMPESWEALFHATHLPAFVLTDLDRTPLADVTSDMRLERAVGVVYRPQTERVSHYFRARLAGQFDAIVHIDHTRGVEPLERTPEYREIEPPETYPFAV